MSEQYSEPPKVIPASTVVIFRNCPAGGPPELLLLQRSKEMRFAGGAVVFPGGRIDPEDRQLAARLFPEADQDVAAARVAGVRETLEETGLAIGLQQQVHGAHAAEARIRLGEHGALAPVLEHYGWSLDLDQLVPFARWCPQIDRAFDTRFFLTNLGTGAVDIAVDATENTRMFWSSAADALAMSDRGEISVIFPTRRNLDRLALFSSYDDARAQAEAYPVQMITPSQQVRDGETWLTIPEDMGYPVTAQPMSSVRRG